MSNPPGSADQSLAKGTVYWLTGLSGAGKTTLGRILYDTLRTIKPNVVLLDGDLLREVFGNDLGHSLSDRQVSAMRNSRLCKMLSDQGMDVVCCTISMFKECREWNRDNISRYKEIYLRVPMPILIDRDQKQLYSRALRGEVFEVMGVDLPFEEPEQPDVVLENDGSKQPAEMLALLLEKLALSTEGP